MIRVLLCAMCIHKLRPVYDTHIKVTKGEKKHCVTLETEQNQREREIRHRSRKGKKGKNEAMPNTRTILVNKMNKAPTNDKRATLELLL